MGRPLGPSGRLLGVRGGLGEGPGPLWEPSGDDKMAPALGRPGHPQGPSRVDFPWIFDGIGADNGTLGKGKVARMPLPQGACHNATMLVALATGTAELATLPFAIEDLRRCHCHGEAATEGIINEFGSVGAALCILQFAATMFVAFATGNAQLKLEYCNDATATGNWPRRGRLLNSSIYIYIYLYQYLISNIYAYM